MTTDFETRDLLRQVKQLERANRRWKIAAGLGMLLVIAISMSSSSDGQAPAERESKVGDKPADEAAKPVVRIAKDKSLAASYANFSRVTGTPEEVILDFGLNLEPFGQPVEPIQVSHCIVMNFYTAKRFWHALGITLQRHEAAFGVLETDVQKRVLPAVK